MAVQLTEGAISMIASGQWQPTDVKPVLQVADIRMVGENERYRVQLSDGLLFQQGMLATQRNDLVKTQQLQKGSVIRLKEFVCNAIRDRTIYIIIDLDVILVNCDTIGDPKSYPPRSGNEPAVTRSPAPAQHIGHPTTTMASPQTFMGSVPRPASSPIYPPQQDHSAGLNSYGNSSIYSRPDPVAAISRAPANSYTRPIQPTYNQNQPPPMYTNRGPVARNEAPARIIPIAALNPYQGRWTIKARVTAKTELRRYNNAKGDGKVFSFDLLDSDGGEIRVTCFNAVADQFFDQIEISKVYLLSKGSVKPASKAFNHLKNDHEILLDNTSTIQPCFEDDSSIPQQQFHFRPIAEIEGLDNNTILDIIGVVYSINPSSSLMRKNGTETQKRTLQLKDMSGRSVEVTLWGNFCSTEGQTLQDMCDSGTFPVLAVKSARVSEFNGKSVGTISTSQLCISPDFPEAQKLKEWFQNGGMSTPSISLSSSITRTDVRKTLSQIKDEKLGTSEKPDWITVSATIWGVKVESFCYTACPLMIGERQCNKKVTNNGDGKWRCDRCDQTVDECDYRYILQLNIQDHTGFTWATAFQETGEEIMGVSAKELYSMKHEEQDEERFTEIIRNVLHTKYNFKLKVKEETYSDEQRVKSTVVKVEKIKPSLDTSFYLDWLKKEDSSSVGVKMEIPVPFKESAPFTNNYMGSVSGVGQMGEFGNQYGGSRVVSSCNSCGGVGHNSANCPSVGSGSFINSVPSGGGGASGECYKCHQSGHWARDCPGVSNVASAYGGENVGGNSGATGECFKCHQSGHWARDCPGGGNVASAYGGGNGVGNSGGQCFKCNQTGHWARDCPGVGNAASGRYGSASGQYVGGY